MISAALFAPGQMFGPDWSCALTGFIIFAMLAVGAVVVAYGNGYNAGRRSVLRHQIGAEKGMSAQRGFPVISDEHTKGKNKDNSVPPEPPL